MKQEAPSLCRRIVWKMRKPEYLFQPSKLCAALFIRKEVKQVPQNIRLPWGKSLEVKPGDAIGQSIIKLGVYELSVSEALWRLLDTGDTFVDAGANIGYMSSLMAARVGRRGNGFARCQARGPVYRSKRRGDGWSSLH